jgi:hypothetical protein
MNTIIQNNIVCLRIRTFKTFKFVEIYFEGTKDHLQLPSKVPSRFEKRILDSFYYNNEIVVHVIDSNSAQCQLRNLQNILTDGMWLSESDWIPHGGCTEAKVPFISAVYGIPIRHYLTVAKYWRLIHERLGLSIYDAPIVVYHGTSKEYVKSILKDGLKPFDGMFGTGVYFGSFWKAYRFATLTQDYRDRDGAIFRCYAFWKRVYIRNHYAPECPCCGVPNYADHKQSWRSRNVDALYMYPMEYKNKWIVKNEEWCALDDSMVCYDTVAYSSRPIKDVTYNPWDRTVQIL